MIIIIIMTCTLRFVICFWLKVSIRNGPGSLSGVYPNLVKIYYYFIIMILVDNDNNDISWLW